VITAKPYSGLRSLWPRTEKNNSVSIYRFFPLNIASFLNLSKVPLVLRALWHLLDALNFHTFFAVRSILKKERPALVLSHNLKGLGYTIPLAIRKCRVPYAHTVHDVQLVEPSGIIIPNSSPLSSHSSFLISYFSLLTSHLFGSPTLVISPSQWLLNFYSSHGFFKSSKRLMVPNPIQTKQEGIQEPDISTQRPFETSTRGYCRDETSSQAERARILPCILHLLYVGQLEPHKGISFLIKALKSWNNAFHLTIAGAGSSEQMLREQLKNDARFTLKGYVKNTDIGHLLQNTDVTLLPSLFLENAPLTISDSFSYGVPVVASHLGGIPEMIKNGFNGFTFKPGDQEDLLKKLEQIAKMKENGTLEQLKTGARKSIKNQTIEYYLEKLFSGEN
jgi:glycosyltransferase involved in cell wall biosynthesis